MSSAKSCLIVVENLPVPIDRRVWQEAKALRDAGWDVAVICPRTAVCPEDEIVIEGIQVYRHALPVVARGAAGFLVEYPLALWHETRLAFRAFRRRRFDVIHVCNPPDLLFLVSLPYQLFGRALIFDQHDICPELFESKFHRRGILHALLRLFEWLTFKSADVVIAANQTFRDIAVGRGGKRPEDVFTVYSVPDLATFRRVAPLARPPGAPVVVGYVGVMGAQDGVRNLIEAIAELRARGLGTVVKVRLVGDGPELATLRALAVELGVGDLCEFTGYLRGDELLGALSTFDIGVIPDPFDVYNDKISMNKVFEYSTLGLPILAFDLAETRRLLGDAALYAAAPTVTAFADELARLVGDPELRRALGARAGALAARSFRWDEQVEELLRAYDRALELRGRKRELPAVDGSTS
jgi:glycosyltransferase involved in cell wall biosynthesis